MSQAAGHPRNIPDTVAPIANMPRTPSLDALRIVVVAARHLSFTEAACELHLTQSEVSHRIRGSEEAVGLSLSKRRTRRLALTPQGRARALAHRVKRSSRGSARSTQHRQSLPGRRE